MEKTFKFYSDPSHGWLAIKVKDLHKVDLASFLITKFSYRRGATAYLEEDLDAPEFIKAYKAKFGEDPKIEEVHTDNRSPIRSYETFWCGR